MLAFGFASFTVTMPEPRISDTVSLNLGLAPGELATDDAAVMALLARALYRWDTLQG